MRWLRQSTSVDLPIGPFLDATDAVTAESGLTITQPDVRLKKNGGAWAQKAAAQTLTHEENGYYEVTLDATDTNTLGLLRLAVHETGALPIFEDFMVLPANVWDSLFGADLLQVDAREWLGGAIATPTTAGVPEVDVTDWKGATAPAMTGDAFARLGAPAGASIAADIAAIEAQTDDIGAAGAGLTAIPWNPAWDAEVQSEVADALDAAIPGTPTANSINERVKAIDDKLPAGSIGDATAANQTTIIGHVDEIETRLGTPANLGGGATIAANLADIEAQTDDIGAAGAGLTAIPWNAAWDAEVQSEAQDALVANHLDRLFAADYDPAAKPGVATALLNELVGSDAGVSQFTANALELAPSGGSAPTAAQIADAVWDETLADHLTAGSTGAGLNAAGSAGDPWSTALPGAYGAGTAGKIVGDNLNATVSSRATPAQVNTEVDTALADYGALKPTVAGRTLDVNAAGEAGVDLDNTSGTLVKGTDITGFNDLSAAAVNAEVDTALADYDPPTRAELTSDKDAIITQVDANEVKLDAVKAKTDLIPASPAAVGSAMTLTSAERDAIAAALLDLANGVETGLTVRQELRGIAAVLLGKSNGAATSTMNFRDTADTKNRVTATVDADGNRSAVTRDLT